MAKKSNKSAQQDRSDDPLATLCAQLSLPLELAAEAANYGNPAQWLRDQAAERHGPPDDEPAAAQQTDKQASNIDQVAPVEPAVALAAIADVPLGRLDPAAYRSRHVEVGHMTPDQATALKRLAIGLDQQGARLANGKHIDSNADAVRWLLEQLGDAEGKRKKEKGKRR